MINYGPAIDALSILIEYHNSQVLNIYIHLLNSLLLAMPRYARLSQKLTCSTFTFF